MRKLSLINELRKYRYYTSLNPFAAGQDDRQQSLITLAPCVQYENGTPTFFYFIRLLFTRW